MSKTFNSIVMLKIVSVVIIGAFMMLSLNVSLWHMAHAANVLEFSNTLSDSAPGVVADHTIAFTTPSGMAAGGTITITMEDFTFGSIGASDFEVEVDSVDVTSGFTLTINGDDLEFEADGSTAIAEDDEVVIRIGTNAGGSNQITNPATTGSYPIQVDVDGDDSGETRIAIVDAVEVTATVDTIFTFTIAGVGASETVNGDTTTGPTTATAIPFGTLEAGQASTTAQDLSVETNATNGFAVTVQTDGPLQTSGGNAIQTFIEGADTTTPSAWVSPTGLIADSDTWSHWGLTTQDSDLSFGSSNYVAATTDPVVVFEHNGPADGTTANIGTTRVGYKIEVSALQPAGEYTTTLTYIATPVF